METSAKTPTNVDQAFLAPTAKICQGISKNKYDLSSDVSSRLITVEYWDQAWECDASDPSLTVAKIRSHIAGWQERIKVLQCLININKIQMTLRAIVEVAVDLNHFRNLDLIHQGVYRINISVFNIVQGHVILTCILRDSSQTLIWLWSMKPQQIKTKPSFAHNTISQIMRF